MHKLVLQVFMTGIFLWSVISECGTGRIKIPVLAVRL